MKLLLVSAALALLAPAVAHADGKIEITATGSASAPADLVLQAGGPSVEDILKIEATGAAMRNAKAQAMRIAEAGGATLGDIQEVEVLPNLPHAAISFSNADAPEHPIYFRQPSGGSSGYDNALGVPSLTVRVAIEVTFALGS